VLDPRIFYPSSPTSPIRLDPTAHGNGFANTGHLDRDPGTSLPPSSTITFTKPGVYHYVCVIHPFMRGTVIVS
jgi:plastocyanin